MSICSPLRGVSWEGFGGIDLDGGSTSLGMGLIGQSLEPLGVHSLCFMFVLKDVSSQLSIPAAMLVACCWASHDGLSTLRTTCQANSAFCKLLLFMVFYHSRRKITNMENADIFTG